MTSIRRVAVVLVSIGALSCAQAPPRRLPVADEMPVAPIATVPAGDLLTFYPRAPSFSAAPELGRYGIECSVPITGGYFTLALRDDRREALFVATGKPVTSLASVVSFGGDPGKSLDWGFVYDRNADGWADYVAFLDGARPVATPAVLALLPRRPMPEPTAEGVRHAISREEGELLMANTRLVFVHYVDDDFDGRTDALVSSLQDPNHWGWLSRRAVLRSSARSQAIDEHWVFVSDIAAREGPIPRGAEGRFVPLGGIGSEALDTLSRSNRLDGFSWPLDVVNAGLRGCRLPRGVLPRE